MMCCLAFWFSLCYLLCYLACDVMRLLFVVCVLSFVARCFLSLFGVCCLMCIVCDCKACSCLLLARCCLLFEGF